MLSYTLDILPCFRRKRPLEPKSFIYLRAVVAIAGLIIVLVYFGFEVAQYRRGDTYLVSRRMNKVSNPEYNGTFPLPQFAVAFSETLTPWLPPYVEINCHVQHQTSNSSSDGITKVPGCAGLLDIVGAGSAVAFPTINPIYLSDAITCASPPGTPYVSLPCPGLASFSIQLWPANNATFPPWTVLYIYIQDTSTSLEINQNNVDQDHYSNNQGTTWAVGLGQTLVVNLKYTLNYPAQEPFYYTFDQQTFVVPNQGNSTNVAAIVFTANTQVATVNVEHYVLPFENVLSLVGGLFNLISSVFIAIFGMGVIAPWSFVSKFFLLPWLRKKLSAEIDEPAHSELEMMENMARLQARLRKLELLQRLTCDTELVEKVESFGDNDAANNEDDPELTTMMKANQ